MSYFCTKRFVLYFVFPAKYPFLDLYNFLELETLLPSTRQHSSFSSSILDERRAIEEEGEMFEAQCREAEWKTTEKFWKGTPTLGTGQSTGDVWMNWYHTSLLREGDKNNLRCSTIWSHFCTSEDGLGADGDLVAKGWDCCKLGVNCQLLPPTKGMVKR